MNCEFGRNILKRDHFSEMSTIIGESFFSDGRSVRALSVYPGPHATLTNLHRPSLSLPSLQNQVYVRLVE